MFAPTLLSTKPLTLYNTCVNYVSFWYLNIFVCLFIKWVYNRCFFVSPLTIKQILFNKSSLQSVLIWTLTTSLMQHNMLLKSVMSYLFNLPFFLRLSLYFLNGCEGLQPKANRDVILVTSCVARLRDENAHTWWWFHCVDLYWFLHHLN